MLAALLGAKLKKAQVASTANARASQATIKAIIDQSEPLVALVGNSSRFEGLCDYQAIVDKAIRTLTE